MSLDLLVSGAPGEGLVDDPHDGLTTGLVEGPNEDGHTGQPAVVEAAPR